jgi:hypothetical protein
LPVLRAPTAGGRLAIPALCRLDLSRKAGGRAGHYPIAIKALNVYQSARSELLNVLNVFAEVENYLWIAYVNWVSHELCRPD